MYRPNHKTKIVATIGPASESQETLERMLVAGMNVARLNFSHGDHAYHTKLIGNIRRAAAATGRRVAIMGDLPGPKMRIGDLGKEPVEIQRDDRITLTTDDIVGDAQRVSVTFTDLPAAVKPEDLLYINDGFILLRVIEVSGKDVHCSVRVGGELRSRKGLNLPGIDLGISAFTDNDASWLRFAAEHRLDAVSQSFVAVAEDVRAVRKAAHALDYDPFIIAKIERATALDNLDEIFEATDGVMVARGDLGVEIPIEQIATVQKLIMEKGNRSGKPVITATQMLENMVKHRRPTRAEATDVANAILDGTDCVMLSAESAMGRFPVESIEMLGSIASHTEPTRPGWRLRDALETFGQDRDLDAVDLIALSIYHTIERAHTSAVVVPTMSGATARNVARFRLPVWVSAVSPREETCQQMQFSWGVEPIKVDADRPDWTQYARTMLAERGITEGIALLTQGPSENNPCGNHRMEILELAAHCQ